MLVPKTRKGLDTPLADAEQAHAPAAYVEDDQTPVRVGGAEVRKLDDQRRKANRKRGRPSGRGYDPVTGREVIGTTYRDEATLESDSETDVFTLVNERGYREDRFYTRSLNADGHGEKLNVRVPQGLDSQIHAAVAQIAEYRSMHDFIRDAAVHRLEYLQKRYQLSTGTQRMLELERIEADLEAGGNEVQRMAWTVDNLATKLRELWEQKDWGLMAEQLERAGEMSDWLRDPYKERAAEVVAEYKGKAKAHIAKMREALDRLE